MKRILVAVDDSAPAFAAADTAIALAAEQRAELHVVCVAEHDRDAATVVAHVVDRAEAAGLAPTGTTTDGGAPFEVLLRVAEEWGADLIVMGRSDKRRPGLPYVGNQTEHLLEFTHVPVLVVPYEG